MPTQTPTPTLKDDEFNPYMKFHGLFIPNGIAMSQIPAQAKLLLGRLLQYSGQDGKAYPTRKTLSKELGYVSLSVIDRNIKTLKNLKLIRTYPLDRDNQSSNIYTFLKNKMYTKPLVKNDSRPPVKNDSRPPVKNDKQNRINKNRINKNSFSKEKLTAASGEADVEGKRNKRKQGKDHKTNSIDSKRKTILDSKRKTILDSKNRTIVPKKKIPKAKYKHTAEDEKNYKWLIDAGATKHTKDKLTGKYKQAGINTLDKLHALLSSKSCTSPYKYASNNSPEYINFKWTIDELLAVFTFQLNHTKNKPIKNISDFIFSKGFNDTSDYSPLLKWHSNMKKGNIGKLTQEGELLLKSLKQRKVNFNGLESRPDILNNVSKEISKLSSKYVFVENDKVTASGYMYGITSIVSKYIKELMDKNYKYNIFWINKAGWVKDDVIPMALKRNILKKKSNGWNVNE